LKPIQTSIINLSVYRKIQKGMGKYLLIRKEKRKEKKIEEKRKKANLKQLGSN
jgi:hypothetical protein